MSLTEDPIFQVNLLKHKKIVDSYWDGSVYTNISSLINKLITLVSDEMEKNFEDLSLKKVSLLLHTYGEKKQK